MKVKLLSAIMILFLLTSCVVSKRSNFGFVKNKWIDKEAEVVSVNASLLFARPLLKGAIEDAENKEDLEKMTKSLRSVKVLAIENQKDNTKIKDAYQKYMNRKNFDEWLSINAEGNLVEISAKQRAEKIKRLMIAINSEDGESVFVRLKGKFNLNDLSDVLGSMAEKKLKDKKGFDLVIN